MKQYEAVIEVMKSKGGYATLGDLYREVFKIQEVRWATKTPLASIRRIVQDARFFFKIIPGLWALKTEKERIMRLLEIDTRKGQADDEFSHSYYQGLLLEIGKLREFETYVPNQDKNRKYLDRPLKDLATLQEFYKFTYDDVVSKASTIDVSWFNERRFPQAFFEVEHSTDFKNSLLKFVELQDFNVNFRIVANKVREKQFESALAYVAFRGMEHRVKFLSYDVVADLHVKTVELNLVQKDL